MKKILHLLSLFIFSVFAQAQVAINSNGTAPNSSAMLDITSTNKGILIPRVSLQTLVDANTIALPATGLLVYNTNAVLNGGSSFFYNSGTPASPAWTRVGDIAYPYYKSYNTAGNSFHIENLNSGNMAVAIKATTLLGTAMYASGGLGYALETSGKIKIAGTGQSPFYGKTLTSDGEGNATWEGAIGFATRGAPANFNLPFAANKKVDFNSEQYDNQSGLSNSIFSAPVAGIYHFDVLVTFGSSPGVSQASPVLNKMFLMSKKNGVTTMIAETSFYATITANVPLAISTDVRIVSGEQVWVEVWQNDQTGYLLPDQSRQRFSGHLLFKVAQGLFE